MRYIFIYILLFSLACKNDDGNGTEITEDVDNTFIPEKVLFIGNSQTYFNEGVDFYIKGYLDNIDLSYSPVVQKVAFSGFTLQDHAENGTTLATLRDTDWDVVVLQENTFRAASDKEAALAGFQSLKPLLSGSRVYLFLTWAYKDDPEMFPFINETYLEAADIVNATIVPVGFAFQNIAADPENGIDLYASDGIHPSKAGTFIAASMFYDVIYDEDPRVNSYNANLEVAQATYLKMKGKQALNNYKGAANSVQK